MHTDLQKCPRCCPQCPHVSPPALLFPDLGHDLKPFLLPKLQVHIVKKPGHHFPVGPVYSTAIQSGMHLELDRAKLSKSIFIFFLTLQSSSLVPTACQSDSTSDFTFLAQRSDTQGQAVTMGISFVLIYVPSCGL